MVKSAIKKSLGRQIVQIDEFQTLLLEAESTVNSRPLTYIPQDDDKVICPADFLNINQSTNIIEVDPDYDPNDPEWLPIIQNRDRVVENLREAQSRLNKLWIYWTSNYITALQDRTQIEHKSHKTDNINKPEIGEIVLVKNEEMSRNDWRLAKIIDLHSDPFRHATIQLGEKSGRKTITTRPLNKLCSLELRASTNQQITPTTLNTRSFLSLLLISTFIGSVFSCSELASISAPATNCELLNEAEMKCAVQFSSLIILRPEVHEAYIQITAENSSHSTTIILQPQNLKLLGRTSTIQFSREHEYKTSYSHRCDRADGGDCFDSFCEHVTDDTKLSDVSSEASNSVGYSRCTRSCGCATCGGCFLCSPSCLFYRFYVKPTTDTIYRIFKVPTFEPYLKLQVIFPNSNPSNLTLSPAIPTHFLNLTFTLAAFEIPPHSNFELYFCGRSKFEGRCYSSG